MSDFSGPVEPTRHPGPKPPCAALMANRAPNGRDGTAKTALFLSAGRRNRRDACSTREASLVVLEVVVPPVIQPLQRLVQRHGTILVADLRDDAELLQLGDGV